ncbi:DUF2190 family protein [Leptospira gomenensis]|uniref:DUF2190 family protein n=1 Tax=Leptospira gomenensis TaxID=2484974 RepID=A0A5F1YDF0_9LEPT|nr:DUF2190 family protein [Leptospira gomenensis]TGK36174.1 DUF2190 family protein [Leptospira gomenensis]TGK42786.1 DUF2190 family protein [Leptospira gomenensis]TGK42975.1 DUF2190 family protein [Leptospira gomenensis]TGK54930.1 DUF2190 family protein [Leptospira gomenensis]
MAKIIIDPQPGEEPQAQVTAPVGGLVKGQVIKSGNILYAAYAYGKAGETVTAHLEAIKAFGTKSNPADVFAQFDTLYWAGDGSGLTKTASGNTKCGIALEASAANETEVRFRFNGLLGI